MKVVVLNFSGNVGKTTIAVELLKPRMKEAPIYSIESINIGADANGVDVEQMRGAKYGELSEEIMRLDSAIVDVGASNVEEFMKLMQQFGGSHEEFDYFIVPVVKEKKAQGDTINTIAALKKIGVDRKRIRIVFNKVDTDESVQEEFSALFGAAEVDKTFTIRPDAVIYLNEVYERLKTVGKTLSEVMADKVDYRQQLREAKSEDEKDFCVRMVSIKRLAVTATDNLHTVFATVFK